MVSRGPDTGRGRGGCGTVPVGAGLACRARALIGSAWHRPVPPRTAAPSRPEQSLVRSAGRASGEARWGRGCRTLTPHTPAPARTPAAPARLRLVPGGREAGVGLLDGRGKGQGRDGPGRRPLWGRGAAPRVRVCACECPARCGLRGGVRSLRLRAGACLPPGDGARFCARRCVLAGLRPSPGRPWLRHCGSVSICVSVHGLFLFLERKFLEESPSLPAVTGSHRGPPPCLGSLGPRPEGPWHYLWAQLPSRTRCCSCQPF